MDVDPIQVPQYQRSNPSAQVPPFPVLIGEHPLLISKTVDGNAMVTNFRFCVCERRSFINIPLMMVGELLVMEAARRLRIGCKDGSTYSCTFATTDDCSVCAAVLKERTGQPQNTQALFAYRFYHIATYKQSLRTSLTPSEEEQISLCQPVNPEFAYSFGKEVERLGFDTSRRRLWRMSHANENFEFCATYPKLHILPATVDDDKLKSSLDFRALKRFPSVVWRDKSSGAVLIRSSQPLSSFLGLSYFQNHSDVTLIEEIVNACNKDREWIAQEQQNVNGHALMEADVTSMNGQENGGGNSNGTSQKEDGAQGSLVSENLGAANGHGASNGTYEYDDIRSPRKLAIVDCRSLAGVWGNSFKGGGTEDEVQYKCNIIHLDMANIHTVRDSFNKLRTLCHSYVEGTYFKNLSGCMWLGYLSAVLRGASIVVELMHVKKRPVLVHCSDGWDRTSQIVSLSELMMDPYYRTLEGFQVLVEREWLHFGHKFGERGGHDPNCSDTNQISPIFLQFLDCVYQLTLQYPAEFQFNEAYLVKLVKHSQACLFGNFLHNCQKERENSHKTASLWSLLNSDKLQFVNLLHKPTLQILTAKYSEHDMVLWKSVYMAGLSPWPHSSQADFYQDSSLAGGGGEEAGNTAAEGMPRSKSMDDLSKINVDSGRRNSDPNTTKNQEVAAAAPGSGDIHDTSSSSAELLHYPEDSPPSGTKPSPSNRSEESVRDSPRKVSPNPSATSIKLTPTAEEKSSPPQNEATGHPHDYDASDIGPEDITAQAPEISPEQITNGGRHEAQISGQASSITVSDDLVLSEDSKAQNIVPSSSAVFGQNEAVVSDSEQTLRCDIEVTSSAPQVLSYETKLSTSNGNVYGYDARQTKSCSQAYSIPVDSATTMTSSAPRATSAGSMSMSYDSLRQTSLLSERLALSGDTEVAMNGRAKESNGHNFNDSKRHLSGEINQHSRKSNDINDLRDTLKAQAQRDMARKIPVDSTQLTHHSNGKNGVPAWWAGEVENNHFIAGTSPLQSLDTQMDGTRTNSNSVSTDTLTEEPETGGGDTVPPSAAAYSKPLEVNTKQERAVATPPPITPSSSSSSLLSSPLKRDSYPSDGNEVTTGSNLMSRRARAASGASRDLSVSPCACRGHWSDTGRLRHPSGGEMVSRRLLGATVATSTTDISDSYVGQLRLPSIDRQASIRQHIDVDGLTLFCDERQDLLVDLVTEKERKILDLESKLTQAIELVKAIKGRQAQQQPPQAALMDELLASDTEGGELSSLGALSNPASDASWEQIDESEAKMVLWVPDSAVTHCAGCDGAFWLYKRKHHCRNCGKVFCAECSNYMAPVPHQHLNKPERVCRRCHSHLLQLSPGASSDGRIPTLVADG